MDCKVTRDSVSVLIKQYHEGSTTEVIHSQLQVGITYIKESKAKVMESTTYLNTIIYFNYVMMSSVKQKSSPMLLMQIMQPYLNLHKEGYTNC